MTFIEKVKQWFKETGLTNAGWVAGFAGAAIFGYWFFAGGALGIFLYTNWNVIRKLWKKEGRSDTQ